jgi:plasmid stabilization system protein ParE
VRQLLVRRIARAEIYEAFNWYLARSPREAAKFIEALEAVLRGIQEAPERTGPIHGKLRRRLLTGYPYGVYYSVHPEVINVVGVIHGSRHSDTWLRREP